MTTAAAIKVRDKKQQRADEKDMPRSTRFARFMQSGNVWVSKPRFALSACEAYLQQLHETELVQN